MNARLLLSLEDIALSFGGKPLFTALDLHINARDRLCLVGKNGAGKTTLMKLMTGALEPDAGKRFVLPGTRIGYLEQAVAAEPEQRVRDFVLSGLEPAERTEENRYLADIVMAPLTLEATAPMQQLSGGQVRRAALARALVMSPDLLLLDEPTNHLDLAAIEWLEEFLQRFAGAVVCISHDRRFLANITRKVLWLDRGRIRVCPTGYAQFEDWQEEQIAHEMRALQNLQKQVEAEHDWTQGGVTGRRKRNVRRLRELDRLRDKLQKDKAAYRQRSQKITMDALEAVTASKIVAEFKGVHKSFARDGRTIPILNDFNHVLLKGDRLGILGKNGSGKSTFLRLLTGEEQPDAGRIFRSKNLEISYFDQNRSLLKPHKTIMETLCPQGGNQVVLGEGEKQKTIHVCGYLKRFLFDPTLVNDKVGTLSGGQQNRLLLAYILSRPGNLMILDEPTNDLDMDTLDMLQEMLADYPGTLVIVSHDRDFLDRTVTEVMAFEGDAQVHTLFGGYSDYLRFRQKQEKPPAPPPVVTAPPKEKPKSVTTRLSYKDQRELEQLPQRIAEAQARMEEAKAGLDDATLYTRDPERFNQLIAHYERSKKTLEQAEARWLELEMQRDS